MSEEVKMCRRQLTV